MEIPSQHAFTCDGSTRVFPIPSPIKGDNYCRIDINDVTINDRTKYDIVNNSIVFLDVADVPDGASLDVMVVQSEEAIGQLGTVSNTSIVADNIISVNTVAGDIDNVNTTATNIANVNTTAGSIANVNTTAGSIVNVNNVGSNIADVTSVATNMAEVLLADTNAATATTKAAEASASATSAAGSATTATTQAGIATTKAGEASTSATNAATSASNSATSATASATSAGQASTSASSAASSATSAATSATNAGTSESNASASATSAGTSATNAANSASAASTSASAASSSASAASSSETNAANSATASSNSASASAASAVSAASSAASAASLLDNFDDRYLGAKTADPALDNDGNALVVGALYFNTTDGVMKVYTASGWIATSSASVATMNKFRFTATSGQTVFTGLDDDSSTLSISVGAEIVTLNGVVLEAGTDYTPASGSITLATGTSAGDELNVFAFGNFQVADTVSKSIGGTFDAGVNFASGIDVTGTVTADGLTVDGNGSFSKANGATFYLEGSTANDGDLLGRIKAETSLALNGDNPASIKFLSAGTTGGHHGGAVEVHTTNKNSTGELKRLRVNPNGDISFYDSVGVSQSFFWDASAESLGIGTSSPSVPLDVVGNGKFTGNSVSINNTTSYAFMIPENSGGYLRVGRDTSTGALYGSPYANVVVGSGAYPMLFGTNNTERARIDASGNLLVGTTDTNPVSNNISSGVQFGDGRIRASRSDRAVLELNRKTSDGGIVDFYKDGTTVGSIVSDGGNILRFASGTDSGDGVFLGTSSANTVGTIVGENAFRPASLDTLDLGKTDRRFKDLYLSGGVYLGGTGSANYLDDYETGTWTPVLEFGGNSVGITFSSRSANYVKVGNLVHAQFVIVLSSKGSSTGTAVITGLPFDPALSNIAFFIYSDRLTFTGGVATGYISSGTSIVLYNQVSGANSNISDAAFADNTFITGQFTFSTS